VSAKTTAPDGPDLDGVLFQIATLDLSRGDTLVLKTTACLSRMQEERLRRQVEGFLDLKARGIKTLILTHGMDIAVLKDPQGDTQ
jgi:hypothetical protein